MNRKRVSQNYNFSFLAKSYLRYFLVSFMLFTLNTSAQNEVGDHYKTLVEHVLNRTTTNYQFLDSVFIKFSTDTLKDRKSTRLNSSHVRISYAVFCLK